MEITWRVISGEGKEGEWGKGTGNKKHRWQVENRQGEDKKSIGRKVEKPKNLYEQPMDMSCSGGRLVGVGVQGRGEYRGEKNGTTVMA